MIPLPWLIAAIALVVGGVSAYATKTNDGPVEQIAEAVIDRELGLPPGTVDITPDSK